jgi:hypothetical protein
VGFGLRRVGEEEKEVKGGEERIHLSSFLWGSQGIGEDAGCAVLNW